MSPKLTQQSTEISPGLRKLSLTDLIRRQHAKAYGAGPKKDKDFVVLENIYFLLNVDRNEQWHDFPRLVHLSVGAGPRPALLPVCGLRFFQVFG